MDGFVNMTENDKALLIAARDGNIEQVKLLLDDGANIDAQSFKDNDALVTPLIAATLNGHSNMVRFLIENGADLNIKTHHGYTALIANIALNAPMAVMLDASIMPNSALLSVTDVESISENLIGAGADINIRDKNGNTPLMWCMKNFAFDTKRITEILVEHGAELELKDNDGRTALHLATLTLFDRVTNPYIAAKDKTDIIEHLYEKGADFLSEDKKGQTVLSLLKMMNNQYGNQYLPEKIHDIIDSIESDLDRSPR